MDQITNIETIRQVYRKSSILNGRTAEERKEILFTWRNCLPRQARAALSEKVGGLVDNREGIGELSALELIFRLVEFVNFVEKSALYKPKRKDENDHRS